MIDWSKLKPYEGNAWKSFEEFCYQVAKSEYKDLGIFTPIDDSGGGDGVEFYLTTENGIQWGWQAKFYFPNKRLKGRKKSIKKSLKRSLEKHPRLEKWFLCTPTNFTSTEVEWFKTLQSNYPSLTIIHWGDSEFNEFIRNPTLIGIKNHFFGELDLSIDWFRFQVEKQLKNVENKYIAELHTDTRVEQYIHYIVKDEFFLKKLQDKKTLFEKQISEFLKLTQNLDKTQVLFEWDAIKSRLLVITSKLINMYRQIIDKLNYIYDHCVYGIYNVTELIDWELNEAEFKTLFEKYEETINEITSENFESTDSIENFDVIPNNLKDVCKKPFYKMHEIYDNLYDIKSILVNSLGPELNISGSAGIGKTHISCHVCKTKIQKDKPAILLHGKHFIGSQPLERQILNILDIPASYSWSDFLKALQSAAEAHKTNIPFVIDALNEAQNIENISNEFLGFAYEISQYDNIILITTCRTMYLKKIWPNNGPKHTIRTYGFEYDSISEAIEKYFTWYKLKCDLTLTPLNHFTNPLFLKIFCESQNKERRVEKEIFLGEQTLLDVFDDYLNICNEYICKKLSRHPSSHIVINALERLSEHFWDHGEHYIGLNDAVKILDEKEIVELDWLNSISYLVLDEGLLLTRDLMDKEESILFTYNLLGGYLIAKYLLKTHTSEDIEEFIKSDEFSEKILDPDLSNRNPLHEDILRCLTLMLPSHFGKHLHQYSDDKYLYSQSVRSFFEMAPRHINTPQMDIISKLFSSQENRINLLRSAQYTFFQNSHPLNFHFWDEMLSSLSMPERDVSWTEFIRLNCDSYITLLNKHDKKIQEITDYTEPIKERYYLVAKVCRFLLTSTVRELRDRATKTLYLISLKIPEYFFELVLNSFHINDPYISERMLAAAYGSSISLIFSHNKSENNLKLLSMFTGKLFSTMFAEEAPYSTTHILSRDYALHLTKLVLHTIPDLLPKDDKIRLCPPFSDGGIRTWSESEDKDKGNYSDGSAPIHMDFENYTIGSLVPGRSNYNFTDPEYQKVRANIYWRLYELGYSHDLFKEIDKQINRRNWNLGRTQNGRKIDRYGKKYSWIAFYEIAGFRRDNNLLPEMVTDEPRLLYADLDPTFPNQPNKCQMIDTDYLGNRSIPVHEWIKSGDTPDLSSILIVDRIDEKEGPWVLLDGFVIQEDIESKRSCFVFPRGLLVKNAELSRVSDLLKHQNLGGRWLPEISEDHYIFAGEIPWSDLFEYNESDELSFIIGKEIKKVTERGFVELEGGITLTKSEILPYVIKNMSKEPDLIERLKIIDKEIIIEKEVNIKEDYEVVVPIRYYSWEGYHSIVNDAGNALVPMKEFAEHLDLHNHHQTFDLFDDKNKRASITVKWGDLWHSGHHLLYLRQDLLEKYLFDNDLALVWAIWGEREFKSREFNELDEFRKQHESYKVFQSIILK